MARGHAFGPDTPWQAEMEEAFPYEPTPDKRTAIEATKGDMERPRRWTVWSAATSATVRPRSRCAPHSRRSPTRSKLRCSSRRRLLADQHFRTFSARFAGFPDAHRRALALQEQGRAESASCAISPRVKSTSVIGTHRLLQRDVAFADLGLIVIDEEQRFGVMHKERLKEYRASVDVLTLSATPIPRTLHMSLLGVRDLSLIQTPPKNRMSIKTLVVPASDAVVQRAIAAELDRGGQVYYLHNRIESIYAVKNALEKLVPRARIADRPRADVGARTRAGDAVASSKARWTCWSRRRSSRTESTFQTSTR